MVRRLDGVSTFDFEVQNTRRKYDSVFTPNDTIVVMMKRIRWLRVFTGLLNSVPLRTAWPKPVSLSASCSLKRLQYWYWDPYTSAAYNMITSYFGSSGADNGGVINNIIMGILENVTGWPKSKVHIGTIPQDWYNIALHLAKDVHGWLDEAQSLAQAYAAELGIGPVISGSVVSNLEAALNLTGNAGAAGALPGGSSVGGSGSAAPGAAPAAASWPQGIKPGTYGGQNLSAAQLQTAAAIWNVGASLKWTTNKDIATALAVAGGESTMGVNLANPTSTARGPFQILDTTGAASGMSLADRMDPTQSAKWFFKQLGGITGRDKMSIQQVGSAIERGGTDYVPWVSAAWAIVKAVADKAAASGAGTAPGHGSATGAGLVATALALIHKYPHIPYTQAYGGTQLKVIGANPPPGLDCSSFVQSVILRTLGRLSGCPRVAADQAGWCSKIISVHEALNTPGALLFLSNGGVAGVHHVEISLGNGSQTVGAHYPGAQPADVSVQTTANIGWAFGGLLPVVSYAGGATGNGPSPAVANQTLVRSTARTTSTIPSSQSSQTTSGGTGYWPSGDHTVTKAFASTKSARLPLGFLKVTTYNVGDGSDAEKTTDFNNLIAAAPVPVVIGATEVHDRYNVLGGVVGYKHVQPRSGAGSHLGFLVQGGIPVLHSGVVPISNREYVGKDVPGARQTGYTEAKTLNWVQIRVNGIYWTIGVTHFVPGASYDADARRLLTAQAEGAAAWFRKQGPNTILMGDFNAEASDPALSALRGVADAYSQVSHDTRAIDIIWVSNHANTADLAALDGYSSDHKPVTCAVGPMGLREKLPPLSDSVTFKASSSGDMLAIGSGQVISKDKTIALSHGDTAKALIIQVGNFRHYYLNYASASVNVGDRVTPGQVLGNAGGPLEFMVRKAPYGTGDAVDPISYIRTGATASATAAGTGTGDTWLNGYQPYSQSQQYDPNNKIDAMFSDQLWATDPLGQEGMDPNVVRGNALGGALTLMNDSNVLGYIKNLFSSTMHSFCSAPNGDLIGWFPDYYGLWGTAAVLRVEAIELQDFQVNWSDDNFVTHQFVQPGYKVTIDPTTGLANTAYTDIFAQTTTTTGIANIDSPQMMYSLFGVLPENAQSFAQFVYRKFGARPDVIQAPQITTPSGAFFMAIYFFMIQWAYQYQASIPVTFMPEAWPGMLVQVPDFDFQAYMTSVTHSFEFGPDGKFETSLNIAAPAYMPRGGKAKSDHALIGLPLAGGYTKDAVGIISDAPGPSIGRPALVSGQAVEVLG